MEGWIETLVWGLIGIVAGDFVWQVRCWIRAKTTNEIARAKAELHGVGRYLDADNVKLP